MASPAHWLTKRLFSMSTLTLTLFLNKTHHITRLQHHAQQYNKMLLSFMESFIESWAHADVQRQQRNHERVAASIRQREALWHWCQNIILCIAVLTVCLSTNAQQLKSHSALKGKTAKAIFHLDKTQISWLKCEFHLSKNFNWSFQPIKKNKIIIICDYFDIHLISRSQIFFIFYIL